MASSGLILLGMDSGLSKKPRESVQRSGLQKGAWPDCRAFERLIVIANIWMMARKLRLEKTGIEAAAW